uniref:Uncharacterized protein n=1 Tax=Geospiza parvula TaxID=87175 RepID=A0A8U8CH87_GEOPR
MNLELHPSFLWRQHRPPSFRHPAPTGCQKAVLCVRVPAGSLGLIPSPAWGLSGRFCSSMPVSDHEEREVIVDASCDCCP